MGELPVAGERDDAKNHTNLMAIAVPNRKANKIQRDSEKKRMLD